MSSVSPAFWTPAHPEAKLPPMEGGSWHDSGSELCVVGVTDARAAQALLLKGVPMRAGFMTKLGGVSLGIAAFKRLQRRFFVLNGPHLEYYNSVEETESPIARPKGSYFLHGATVAQASSHPRIDMARWPHVLVLQTAPPNARVRAASRLPHDLPRPTAHTSASRFVQTEALICHSADALAQWFRALQGVIDSLATWMPLTQGTVGQPGSLSSIEPTVTSLAVGQAQPSTLSAPSSPAAARGDSPPSSPPHVVATGEATHMQRREALPPAMAFQSPVKAPAAPLASGALASEPEASGSGAEAQEGEG